MVAKTRTQVVIDNIAKQIYAARKARKVHPEGTFDNAKRWYPSEREDAEGDGSTGRTPSREWPFSYMARCRTLAHCKVLVARGLAGKDVPPDVSAFTEPTGGMADVIKMFREIDPTLGL